MKMFTLVKKETPVLGGNINPSVHSGVWENRKYSKDYNQ